MGPGTSGRVARVCPLPTRLPGSPPATVPDEGYHSSRIRPGEEEMAGSAQQIRELLVAGQTINMPGVYDALTARLATEAGFEVLFISGYSVSGSRLGLPDFGYLTQTEVTDAARRVCSATDLPVIVDAGKADGNPLSAIRTARLLAGAGGAGIFLEDQQWPKKCGHFAGKQVVPAGEWLAKLRAVLDLRRQGIDLFLLAPTDARAAA